MYKIKNTIYIDFIQKLLVERVFYIHYTAWLIKLQFIMDVFCRSCGCCASCRGLKVEGIFTSTWFTSASHSMLCTTFKMYLQTTNNVNVFYNFLVLVKWGAWHELHLLYKHCLSYSVKTNNFFDLFHMNKFKLNTVQEEFKSIHITLFLNPFIMEEKVVSLCHHF